MEIAIFAKRMTRKDGTPFFKYLSTLHRKDGTTQTVGVRFRDDCGHPKPENCPINIKVDKNDANMVRKDFVREDTGEVATSFTLWVSKWVEGSPYVDTSLDEYDV